MPRHCCQVNAPTPLEPMHSLPVAALLVATQRCLCQVDFYIPPCAPVQFAHFYHRLRSLHVAASCAATQHCSSQVDCCFMFFPLVPLHSLQATKAAAARLIVDAAFCRQVDY